MQFVMFGLRCILLLVSLLLTACGGGSSSSSGNSFVSSQAVVSSSATSSLASASSASSTLPSSLILSGTVTYDYIPHQPNHRGLDYAAVEARPVRGAIVELLDESAQLKASATTSSDGRYAFSVQPNTQLKIRVKAQLLHNQPPTWDFKVTDNTSGNALYVLEGALVSTGTVDSERNLHAASGWDGQAYTATRAAAPFAILDDIYIGVERLQQAGNSRNLNPLELRWSIKNSAADGDLSKGEIATSFYNGGAIYILGDADNDTDEYDSHVLLHEWGHYVEDNLFRSDSPGGDHSSGQRLDLRVAMSEGFANAFSAMMLDDANYADASGIGQASGFSFNVAQKQWAVKGFYSEASIGSIFYNFYTSSLNKIANDFTPIFQILSNPSFYTNDALTSIYLFYSELKTNLAAQKTFFQSLLQEQNINGTDEYATNETNSAGSSVVLPVYRKINPDNSIVNLCSSAEFGKGNKLGNSQFLKLTIAQPGNYSVFIKKSGGDSVISKPEFWVYQKGHALLHISNTLNDSVSGSSSLSAGIYIIEVYDLNNHDDKNTDTNTTCFNVQVAPN